MTEEQCPPPHQQEQAVRNRFVEYGAVETIQREMVDRFPLFRYDLDLVGYVENGSELCLLFECKILNPFYGLSKKYISERPITVVVDSESGQINQLIMHFNELEDIYHTTLVRISCSS